MVKVKLQIKFFGEKNICFLTETLFLNNVLFLHHEKVCPWNFPSDVACMTIGT